jgi:hypothetical protein
MICVTFIPTKGGPINGILIRREGTLLEVAFDETPEKPLLIGWINPVKQIGEVKFQSAEGARWHHPAMRMILAGDVVGARKLYYTEENARKLARLKKEGSV